MTPVTTTRVPRIIVRQLMKNLSWFGILASMISRSDENLLRILPVGVVSKKDIGACIVFSSSEWWMVREASAALNWQPI